MDIPGQQEQDSSLEQRFTRTNNPLQRMCRALPTALYLFPPEANFVDESRTTQTIHPSSFLQLYFTQVHFNCLQLVPHGCKQNSSKAWLAVPTVTPRFRPTNNLTNNSQNGRVLAQPNF